MGKVKTVETEEASKVRVVVYLPKPIAVRLRHLRADTRRPVSAIVHEAVDRFLDPPVALRLADLPDQVKST